MKRTNTAAWLEKYNRWQINVQKDGKRRSFTSSIAGRTGQREANAKADAWLDDNIDNTNTRISVLFTDYVESLKLTTSKSNWTKIDYLGTKWILPEIQNKKISSLTEQHLQNSIDKAFAKGLSKKTLSSIRATITSFLKYCRKRKVSTLLPENLTIPKGARVAEKRILQPADLRILFSVDTTLLNQKRQFDKFVHAYRFEILTGLRPGELIGLEWEDIVGDTVYVKRAINTHGEETKGKNENAIRKFVLNDWARQEVEAQKKISTSALLFDITSQATYRDRWTKYCKANGISHISLYEMRHTFVSIAKNLSEGQLRPIIGHSKSMDTFGTYGHEMNGELQKTAADLGALFSAILIDDK